MRRGLIAGLAALGVLLVLVLILAAPRARRLRGVPSWLDPSPPGQGVIPETGVLSPAESLAANGCWPMIAPCNGHTARRDTMRLYPANLCDEPSSLVQRYGVN